MLHNSASVTRTIYRAFFPTEAGVQAVHKSNWLANFFALGIFTLSLGGVLSHTYNYWVAPAEKLTIPLSIVNWASLLQSIYMLLMIASFGVALIAGADGATLFIDIVALLITAMYNVKMALVGFFFFHFGFSRNETVLGSALLLVVFARFLSIHANDGNRFPRFAVPPYIHKYLHIGFGFIMPLMYTFLKVSVFKVDQKCAADVSQYLLLPTLLGILIFLFTQHTEFEPWQFATLLLVMCSDMSLLDCCATLTKCVLDRDPDALK